MKGFINSKLYRYLKSTYVEYRNRLILWNNRRRTFIRVEVHNKLPRFIIPEKYERLVTWLLRGLAVLGIILSAITLRWYLSLGLAVMLLIFELVLKATIFQFTTIFIQPVPVKWDNSKWLAMVFFQIESRKYLGMLIEKEKQAQELYECLKAWNYGRYIDEDNNIRLSFVIENDNTYTAFIYPSFERSVVKKFKENVDYEMFKRKELKNQQQIILSIVFCKAFPYKPKSALHQFISGYKPGTPFAFVTYFCESSLEQMSKDEPFMIKLGNGRVKPVGTKPIIKFHVDIKHRSDLTAHDFEYQYSRLIIGK